MLDGSVRKTPYLTANSIDKLHFDVVDLLDRCLPGLLFLHIEECVRITETRIGNENPNRKAKMISQPYPKYKESGFQWLGEVLGDWEVRRLKLIVRNIEKKVEADDDNPLQRACLGRVVCRKS